MIILKNIIILFFLVCVAASATAFHNIDTFDIKKIENNSESNFKK